MSLSRSSSLSVDEVSIPSPSITFPANSCVEAMIVDDEIVEGVETVSLGLISTDPAVFATNSVLLTITDTDRTSAHCQGCSLSHSLPFPPSVASVQFGETSYTVTEGASVSVCANTTTVMETAISLTLGLGQTVNGWLEPALVHGRLVMSCFPSCRTRPHNPNHRTDFR